MDKSSENVGLAATDGQLALGTIVAMPALAFTATQMRAAAAIRLNEDLINAYQAPVHCRDTDSQ